MPVIINPVSVQLRLDDEETFIVGSPYHSTQVRVDTITIYPEYFKVTGYTGELVFEHRETVIYQFRDVNIIPTMPPAVQQQVKELLEHFRSDLVKQAIRRLQRVLVPG
jgi:accessory colonization factor AcfC